MRTIIICIFMSLCACGSDSGQGVVSQLAPSPTPDPGHSSEYLELGAYTGLNYCEDATCTYVSPSPACVAIFNWAPHDFTFSSLTNGTWFSSVYENVNIDNDTVYFTTNATSHNGWSYKFKHLGQDLWQVNYTTQCGRIYQKVP